MIITSNGGTPYAVIATKGDRTISVALEPHLIGLGIILKLKWRISTTKEHMDTTSLLDCIRKPALEGMIPSPYSMRSQAVVNTGLQLGKLGKNALSMAVDGLDMAIMNWVFEPEIIDEWAVREDFEADAAALCKEAFETFTNLPNLGKPFVVMSPTQFNTVMMTDKSEATTEADAGNIVKLNFGGVDKDD